MQMAARKARRELVLERRREKARQQMYAQMARKAYRQHARVRTPLGSKSQTTLVLWTVSVVACLRSPRSECDAEGAIVCAGWEDEE